MNSFTGATAVLMADGSRKAIKDVQVGEEVVATDPETGRRGAREVEDLIRHWGPHTMVGVVLSDGSRVEATDRHPFWVESEGRWVDAIDLHAGDTLLAADGDQVTVDHLDVGERVLTAYNLTIEDLHTYYAGNDSVLVHNTTCGGVSRGWSVGDDVYSPTRAGNRPAWSTVRARFWKNEGANPGLEQWDDSQLSRMATGRAPQRYNGDKGGMESMELSHEPIPFRDGGTSVVPRWPQDHAAVDSYRHPGY